MFQLSVIAPTFKRDAIVLMRQRHSLSMEERLKNPLKTLERIKGYLHRATPDEVRRESMTILDNLWKQHQRRSH